MYINIKNLSKKIKNIEVLHSINLEFNSGNVYGLSGKNGSGKTMLMRSICGLIMPTSGEININGEILHKDISFPRSLGALIEAPSFLPNLTGSENLELLASIKKIINKEDIKKILLSVGLNPNDNKIFKKYSLGMKQKLGIAYAFMENPDIIILDEPLNALDENSVILVKNLIELHKKRDAIIIIACHDKNELQSLSNSIIKIENGCIIYEKN